MHHRRTTSGRSCVELQLLEARTLLNGLTIITHGYQAFSSSAPAWVSTMKDAVVARLGPDTTVYRMKLDYNAGNSPYVSSFTRIAGPAPNTPGSSSAESVLVLDWAAVSGVIFSFTATSTLANVVVPFLTNPITWPDFSVTPPLA